jgi:hypothetical protein
MGKITVIGGGNVVGVAGRPDIPNTERPGEVAEK